MTIQARFDFIGMVAADLPATLAFYRRLGLDIPPEADTAPHVEVDLPGGLRLGFDPEETVRSFAPDWEPPKGSGRIGLAFLLPDAAGVDAAYRELVDAGYRGENEPFDAPWGQRYATVLDPDGNGVDLFAPTS